MKRHVRKRAFRITAAVAAVALCVALGVLLATQNEFDELLPSGGVSEDLSVAATTTTASSAAGGTVDGLPAVLQVVCTVENVSDEELPAAATTLLRDYVTDYYTALGTLTPCSLTTYFDTTTARGALYAELNNAVQQHIIFTRQNRALDFSFRTAAVRVTVTEVECSESTYTVTYMLDTAVRFACMDSNTYTAWQKSEAVLVRDGDDYRFEQLAEDTDANLLFEEQVMYCLGYDWELYYLKDMYIPATVDSAQMIADIAAQQQAIVLQNIADQAEQLAAFRADPTAFAATRTATYPYDRAAAVAYTEAWVGEGEILRNPAYDDLSEIGGNCQNFVSQCVHAGGIPMDWSGDITEQWKYFSINLDYSQQPAGRSPAWSGTGFFYNYCIESSDPSIVAEEGENLYSAQPGDVLQFMEDGWPRHSVLVTGYLYDDAGQVADLLIAGNTTDCKNFPLSAYGYTGVRLLRILGCN